VERSELDVDPHDLRLAMRRWATGVTIVTSKMNEIKHGMTVSSFTSVSLDPPTVLISLEKTTRTHDLVQGSGLFGVTILGSGQAEISDRFAGRQTEYEDRFLGLDTFTLETGVPLLADGLASFDCRVVSAYEVGSHTIFIGDVLASQIKMNENKPLIYFNRDYRNLCE
jgi:flavin reductase (DIM6/NTAB) family NADH-FMN oxidoreductase RutF